MIDRTTKLLLLAIAIGLWMNVAAQWLQPIPVQAASEEIEQVFSRSIQFEQYSYRQLARNRTFRRAVERVVGNCQISGGYVESGYVYGSRVSC